MELHQDAHVVDGSDKSQMFPFVISYDPEGAAIDRSALVGEKEAGSAGFIRAEGSHFFDDEGEIRFFSVNLTGGANLPSGPYAARMARRLRHFGVNCARLHYFDADYATFMLKAESGIIDSKGPTLRRIDPAQLDRLDFLVAELKKCGIYVNLNLHVARVFDGRDGFQTPGVNLEKTVGLFNGRMIALQKEYARDLLTHLNPYTGLEYRNDSAVAMIEINNENGLVLGWKWGHLDYATAGDKACLQELYDKYRTGKSMPHKAISVSEEGAEGDFEEFLYSLEEDYFLEMYRYLKEEIKARQIVSGSQVCNSPASIQSKLDYVDNHGYFSHPAPVTDEWRICNQSMIRNGGGTIVEMSRGRVKDKPYTIGEYNHPYPNFYGAEGVLMLAAYASLLSWDGIFYYSYNNRRDSEPSFVEYFFSFAARTDCLAHFPAAANLFLRRDVDSIGEGETVKPNEKQGQVYWSSYDGSTAYWTVDAPRTKVFAGFPYGRRFEFGGGVVFEPGKTKLGWCAISLTSQNRSPLEKGAGGMRALLAATGFTCNSNAEFEFSRDGFMRAKDGCWGTGPVMTEGVYARIEIPALPGKTKAYALDEAGNRKERLPVEEGASGNAQILIGPGYRTVWYEIETLD